MSLYSTSSSSTSYVSIGMKIGRPTPAVILLENVFEKIRVLADKMGYTVEQRNGQRIFGPPLNWTGPPPSQDCEIFVGKIPKNIYEDVLIPLFALAGTLYQFRLMMNFNGNNRGFAFVKYICEQDAYRACRLFNEYNFAPNNSLTVAMCNDNNSLFIGRIPGNIDKYEIFKIILKNTVGVTHGYLTDVDGMGRRCAVLRFKLHRDAALARRFLMTSYYKMWGTPHRVIVDWKTRHDILLPVRRHFEFIKPMSDDQTVRQTIRL